MICPNHKMEPICCCGKNASCRRCGIGIGAYPCDCTPKTSMTLTISPRTTAPLKSFEIAEDFDEPMELVSSKRLAVLESLERSIKENAEIFRILADF